VPVATTDTTVIPDAPNVVQTFDYPKPPVDPLAGWMQGVPTAEQIQKREGFEASILQAKMRDEEEDRQSQRREADRLASMMERKFQQVEASREDLKPWNRSMAPEPHDIWEKLGSPGMLFAMIGSRFSAMPMNTAFAAGGAAIKAINEGDMDAYNQAFNEWKVNSDLAIHRHAMEQAEFDDLAKLAGIRDNTWRTRFEQLATKYSDTRTLGLLQMGMDDKALEQWEARRKAMQSYMELMPKALEAHALTNYMNEAQQAGKSPWDAYVEAQKKLAEAKASGRYGLTATAQQMAEVVRRDSEWLKNNPKQPDESDEDYEKRREAAHDTHMSDVVTAAKPLEKGRLDLAKWKAEQDDEHKRITDDLKARKITLDEAKAKVDEQHKRNMDENAVRKEGQAEARDAEMERWHKAREDLDRQKFEVSTPKVTADKRREITAKVIAEHASDPNWKTGDTQLEVDKLIKAAGATPKGLTGKAALEKMEKDVIAAGLRTQYPDWPDDKIVKETNKAWTDSVTKRSTTPEGIALNKFLEKNPDASPEQIQAFRQLGRSMARSPAAAYLATFIAEQRAKGHEVTAEEIRRASNLFQQTQATARTLGTRIANIDTAVNEVKKFASAAIAASEKVPRTSWTTINDYYERGLTAVSAPEMTVLVDANNALTAAYGQAITRSGGNTVFALQMAERTLNIASGHKAYKAGAEFIIMETELVNQAVKEVAEENAGGGGVKIERTK
jgi:hypothetical protein